MTSFLRPDRERKDARVYMTLWDPRQLALHMQAGTVEPLSATGEAGPGQIPREPAVMKRVVTAAPLPALPEDIPDEGGVPEAPTPITVAAGPGKPA